jgi:hypothetical protein
VLYTAIQATTPFGLNLPHLLQQCRQQHSTTTPWAMDTDPRNSCPPVYLNDTAATLFLRSEGTQLVPGSPLWAFSNILQAGKVMEEPAHVALFINSKLGFSCLQIMFAVMLSIAPVFLLTHYGILQRYSSVYRGLQPMQQLVCCQHAVYAVVLGLQLVPQSILVTRMLFRAWDVDYVASVEPTLLFGAFLTTHALLYVIEASVRSIRFSWLLLAHHQLFFVIIMAGVWSTNMTVLVLGMVLDWFVAHECWLYVVLVMYRLQAPRRLTLGALYWASAWYIATRLVQTVLLLYPIISWAFIPAVRGSPGYIITSVMCGVLTVIQVYTLSIYKVIGVKLLKQQRGFQAEAEDACKDPAAGAPASSDTDIVVSDGDAAWPGDASRVSSAPDALDV